MNTFLAFSITEAPKACGTFMKADALALAA